MGIAELKNYLPKCTEFKLVFTSQTYSCFTYVQIFNFFWWTQTRGGHNIGEECEDFSKFWPPSEKTKLFSIFFLISHFNDKFKRQIVVLIDEKSVNVVLRILTQGCRRRRMEVADKSTELCRSPFKKTQNEVTRYELGCLRQTSSFTGLVSIKQVKLMLIKHKQISWIQTK